MIDLYYAPDNASLIIRIVLEELDIEHRAILVDRSQKKQKDPAYLSLNPNGLIPVCIIDGQPVFETAAIALTLADRAEHFGATNNIGFAPQISNCQRPQFLKWLFFLSNTLHSDLRQMFYPGQYVGSDESLQEAYRVLTRQRLQKNFEILDKQYAQQDKLYLFGDDPSIIDVYLALCIRWAQIYPVSARGLIKASDFPSIETMLTHLQVRESVVSACAKEGIRGTFFSNPDYANPVEGGAV